MSAWDAYWLARVDEIRAALPKIVEALETQNRLLAAIEARDENVKAGA